MKKKQSLTIKTINKRSVWEIQENDVFRMWKNAERDADLRDNKQHYAEILSTAFEMEEIVVSKPEVTKKYKERGFKVGVLKGLGKEESKWGIKKRRIIRITDLTRDNIYHISASMLLELIDRNFGGGWDSLSPNVQDIIQTHFDIATTTLPKDRLHNKGGLYDQKVAEKYDILEISKGTWVEVIFAKEKPEIISTEQKEFRADESDEPIENSESNEPVYPEGNEGLIENYENELKEEETYNEEFEEVDFDEEFNDTNRELTLDDVVAREDRD